MVSSELRKAWSSRLFKALRWSLSSTYITTVFMPNSQVLTVSHGQVIVKIVSDSILKLSSAITPCCDRSWIHIFPRFIARTSIPRLVGWALHSTVGIIRCSFLFLTAHWLSSLLYDLIPLSFSSFLCVLFKLLDRFLRLLDWAFFHHEANTAESENITCSQYHAL